MAVVLACGPAAAARAAAAGTAAAGTRVQPLRGLDVSAYQHARGPIDWPRLARQGFRFVAVKATEGNYYLNPYYPSDARAAAAAGLVVLPYAFANPARASGAATARFAVRATGITREPLVVDLENDPYRKHRNCYGLRVPAMIRWVAGLLTETYRLTGRRPVIYTTADWWAQCTGSTREFRLDPLWLAAFGAPPATPHPWSQWAFWQYADNDPVPGVGPVDLDYYHPTDALSALAGRKQQPAPPRKGEARKPPKKRKQPGRAA